MSSGSCDGCVTAVAFSGREGGQWAYNCGEREEGGREREGERGRERECVLGCGVRENVCMCVRQREGEEEIIREREREC